MRPLRLVAPALAALVLLSLPADAGIWKQGRAKDKACVVDGKRQKGASGYCDTCQNGLLVWSFAALCDGAEAGSAKGTYVCRGQSPNRTREDGMLRGDAAYQLSKVAKSCPQL